MRRMPRSHTLTFVRFHLTVVQANMAFAYLHLIKQHMNNSCVSRNRHEINNERLQEMNENVAFPDRNRKIILGK